MRSMMVEEEVAEEEGGAVVTNIIAVAVRARRRGSRGRKAIADMEDACMHMRHETT